MVINGIDILQELPRRNVERKFIQDDEVESIKPKAVEI
jgi:hypothetical protein